MIAASRERTPSPGFDPAQLLRHREEHPGARGAKGLDRVVELIDPRAESPPETRLRLLLVPAGLPPPQVQYRLYEHGEVVARFDLAYPEARLAIEYDGDEHDDALDRARDLRTSALGRHTLRLLTRDLTRSPARTVTVVRDLRELRYRMLDQDTRAVTRIDQDSHAVRP